MTDPEFYDREYKFEKNFWGDCTNTFGEDQKHYVYARLMKLECNGFYFDVQHKAILDIGGGPTSMLLKVSNLSRGMVCDPIRYPDWVYARYKLKGVVSVVLAGEDIETIGWDEVWIYNVLQHCRDPERIVQNAWKAAPLIRLFEWIDIPPHPGHPQMLTEADLSKWLGVAGTVGELTGEAGCYGKFFAGVFSAVGNTDQPLMRLPAAAPSVRSSK
jgi:hypothetical protein